jgi:Flp pilus assembly protein TadB
MLLTIALILAATIALAALELWLFWRLGERDDRRRIRRAAAIARRRTSFSGRRPTEANMELRRHSRPPALSSRVDRTRPVSTANRLVRRAGGWWAGGAAISTFAP